MVSVIICSKTREAVERVKENIEATIGVPHEIIVIENPDGQFGICTAYNRGGTAARFDILCFMHEDVSYETIGWGHNVVRHLAKKKTGLIGVAGGDTKSLVPSSWPSSIFESEISIIQYNSSNWKNGYRLIKTGYPDNKEAFKKVACLDGVWMCTRKDIFEKFRFDDETFKGFHGYDIDYSLQVATAYDVCVVFDVLIHHYSAGSFNRAWLWSTILVSRKWKDKLPFTVRQISDGELVRQHWTSMNVFIDRMIECGYGRAFMFYQLLAFSVNRYFHFRHSLHSLKKLMLKTKQA
jgi:GT2 family glycosyltransferase